MTDTGSKLRVLVVEPQAHDADQAIEELVAAGHEVARCVEAGRASFPCAAYREGCPLECGRAIDVVVDVRRHARSQLAPGEFGMSCAVRRHVPLVLVGPNILHPFDEFAIESTTESRDVVRACERAAARPLPAHSRVATNALTAYLDGHAPDVTRAKVEVFRRNGALAVVVGCEPALPASLHAMAGTRLCAALRAIDRHATGIDVSFAPPS
jgi:hypothetical protein